MVHCNNCTNEINAWAQVFKGFLEALGQKSDMNQIFTAMFTAAQAGQTDGGGLVLYNYLSGEPITRPGRGTAAAGSCARGIAGFPQPDAHPALFRFGYLKIGLDILGQEQVKMDRLLGHGGFFKTPVVGQKILAAAAGAPVSVMETAGEGGPWGMALLARLHGQPAGGGVPGGLSGAPGVCRAAGIHPAARPEGAEGVWAVPGPLWSAPYLWKRPRWSTSDFRLSL